MTLISIRFQLSGPDSALMVAKEALNDFKRDSGREAHQAAMMHTSAEVHLGKGEFDDAMTMCKDAQRLYERLDIKRGVAAVWHTIHSIHAARKEESLAVK